MIRPETFDHQRLHLVDKHSNQSLPQKLVSFDVDVVQGFADLKITQVYENTSSEALEIQFKMPYSDTFSLNQLQADFILEDGSQQTIVTKIEER